MWNYPQMYYFNSPQVFNLFKPKSKALAKQNKKDTAQSFNHVNSSISYEFNSPDILTIDPVASEESFIEEIFETYGQSLGQVMVSTGLALIVPEGTELFVPITLIDEVIGFTLIVGGIIFQLIY